MRRLGEVSKVLLQLGYEHEIRRCWGGGGSIVSHSGIEHVTPPLSWRDDRLEVGRSLVWA